MGLSRPFGSSAGDPNRFTGWADYVDDQYTSASPFQIVADTPANLPNNAATVRGQLPEDVAAFYAAGKITGRENDALEIKIRFNAKPTNVSATYLQIQVDIGGGVGIVEDRIITFPKGANVERPVHLSFLAYTLDTWAANGGTVKVVSDGPVDLYDISYVFGRLHKAR